MLRWFFKDERARQTMVEWEEEADLTVSWLRSRTATCPDDPRLQALYDDLHHIPAFQAMYRCPALTTHQHKPP